MKKLLGMSLYLFVVGCGGGGGGAASAPLPISTSIPSPVVTASSLPAVAVVSMTTITTGVNASYSVAAGKLAFSRFDPTVVGANTPSGANDSTGTYELWTADADGTGSRCLSCRDVAGGPRANQHKGAATWHPSGAWLVAAVEMPAHSGTHSGARTGNGAYNDIYAVSSDGSTWVRLTNYDAFPTTNPPARPIGALIPRLSPSGKTLVWAELLAGIDSAHPLGQFRMAKADFVIDATGPHLTNNVVTTPGPASTQFYEPWSFSPDENVVLLASDAGQAASGYLDIQAWNTTTGTLTNLTSTSTAYEEQGAYSVDGSRIAFMSTQNQSPAFTPFAFVATLHTDAWLMNPDGTGKQRITWFNDSTHAEYQPGGQLVIPTSWGPGGNTLYVDVHPPYAGQTLSGPGGSIYQLRLSR